MPLRLRALGTDLDRLLRGEFVRPGHLRVGRVGIEVPPLIRVSLLLGAAYGLCMGFYAIMRGGSGGVSQMISTAVKVPLLFLLTLAVTFPSLYAFSALAGSRLRLGATLRLLVHAIAVNATMLASFGPVVAFFTLCTDSYSFMKLLNVIFFTVTGIISLRALRKTLLVVFEEPDPPSAPETTEPVEESDEQAADRPTPSAVVRTRTRTTGDRARRVFALWFVIYAAVGAQMGWVLRPFIGSPDLPFQLLRPRQSSFFEDLLETLRDFLT